MGWQEIQNKIADRIFKKMKIESDPAYPEKFKKVLRWLGYKFPNILSTIASFIVLIWIFSRINTKYGIERMFIVAFVIIIFTLRGISKNIGELAEKKERKNKSQRKERKNRKI